MSEKWLENAEDLIIFKGGNRQDTALKLLERTSTNRTIVSGEQAQALILLRFAALRFKALYPESSCKYDWILSIADSVEEYQMTIAGEDNTRRQFMKVFIAQAASRVRQFFRNEVNHLVED